MCTFRQAVLPLRPRGGRQVGRVRSRRRRRGEQRVWADDAVVGTGTDAARVPRSKARQ